MALNRLHCYLLLIEMVSEWLAKLLYFLKDFVLEAKQI
jgi:hypothetical protein